MPKGTVRMVPVSEPGVDDYDGKELSDDEGQSIYLAFGDQAWNLYLRPANVEKLTSLLAKYTEKAAPAKKGGGSRGAVSMTKEERKALMEWSRKTDGIAAVADRGAVKKTTLEAWQTAGKPGFSA